MSIVHKSVIFLSSTCYDLKDIRSIIVPTLKDAGFDVIASDIPESEFKIAGGKSSIELSLENVERSDVFVIIFDQRYGPPIPGYNGKSATHLEYIKAVIVGIPIITFPRKDFLEDYRTWQKMIKAGYSTEIIAQALIHVDTTLHGDQYEFEALFKFFDELRRATEPKKNNWYDAFEDAYELSKIVLRRVREIVSSDSSKIRRLLILAFLSKGDTPIFLSKELVKKAIDKIREIDLPESHIRMIADAAVYYQLDIDDILKEMGSKNRNNFLSQKFETLISSKYSAHLREYTSKNLLNTAKSWMASKENFHSLLSLWNIFSGNHELFISHLQNTLHSILVKPFYVSFNVERQIREKELHKDKVEALKILAEHGGMNNLPYILFPLGERGVPYSSIDEEHISMEDKLMVDGFFYQDELATVAINTLVRMHKRKIPGIIKLLQYSIDKVGCCSLKINLFRALARLFPNVSDVKVQEFVEQSIKSDPKDELLLKLFEDLYRAGISIESKLLFLCNYDTHLRNICLQGLVWHATSQALPTLLDAVDSWGDLLLDDIAYVIRFLVNSKTRSEIVDAFNKKLLKKIDIPFKQINISSVTEVVGKLGIYELKNLLDNLYERLNKDRVLSNYNKTLIKDALQKINLVEKLRSSKLERKNYYDYIRTIGFEQYQKEVEIRKSCLEQFIQWPKSFK